jgi:Ribosomal protein L7/L12 C-terminal domain
MKHWFRAGMQGCMLSRLCGEPYPTTSRSHSRAAESSEQDEASMRIDCTAEEMSQLLDKQREAGEALGKAATEAELIYKNSVPSAPVPYVSGSNYMGLASKLSQAFGEVARGNKINAIKLVREATGMELKEAKDIVEGNFR